MAIIFVDGNSYTQSDSKPRPIPPIVKGVAGALFPQVDDLTGNAEGGR